MDDGQAIGAEWEAMKRTIAHLFALGRRADAAAVASFPVLCLVLWILRRALPVALDIIGGDEPPSAFWRYSRAEAMRLAKIFRMAARTVEAELRMERRLVRKAKAAAKAALTAHDKQETDAGDAVEPLPTGLDVPPDRLRRLGFRALDSPLA